MRSYISECKVARCEGKGNMLKIMIKETHLY